MNAVPQPIAERPFESLDQPYQAFWQGGFEGADHINGSAIPLCMNTLTGHVRNAAQDYRRLAGMGFGTVRESAGWRSIERSGGYDFESVGVRARRAREAGVQVLWTFFHYGMPKDLDIFAPEFIDRFASYCGALARFLRPFHRGDAAPVYTPINEISFLSWAVCETGLLHPHRGDRVHEGYELKKHLVRAQIAACDAIRDADPRARFLVVDPLGHIAPRYASEAVQAQRQSDYQFQAWDMLYGMSEPQLGGSPRYLDLIGINYYPDNQREYGSTEMLPWPSDPRRRPLSDMLQELHGRYGRPISISETSHVGEHRGAWLSHVAQEVRDARRCGVPVQGLCLYPVINRPDWEQPQRWHDSGLWHVHPVTFRRRLDRNYASALRQARSLLEQVPAFAPTLPGAGFPSPTPGAPWTP